jgi:hypothetical protein
VECFNASLRGRFARFNRRTKAFNRSPIAIEEAVFLWLNRATLLSNLGRYGGHCTSGVDYSLAENVKTPRRYIFHRKTITNENTEERVA